jgi:hypothetical protein
MGLFGVLNVIIIVLFPLSIQIVQLLLILT